MISSDHSEEAGLEFTGLPKKSSLLVGKANLGWWFRLCQESLRKNKTADHDPN